MDLVYPLIGYELSIDNSKREKEFKNSFSGLEKDKKDKGKNTKKNNFCIFSVRIYL